MDGLWETISRNIEVTSHAKLFENRCAHFCDGFVLEVLDVFIWGALGWLVCQCFLDHPSFGCDDAWLWWLPVRKQHFKQSASGDPAWRPS